MARRDRMLQHRGDERRSEPFRKNGMIEAILSLASLEYVQNVVGQKPVRRSQGIEGLLGRIRLSRFCMAITGIYPIYHF
jgi:hypothetical protein